MTKEYESAIGRALKDARARQQIMEREAARRRAVAENLNGSLASHLTTEANQDPATDSTEAEAVACGAKQ